MGNGCFSSALFHPTFTVIRVSSISQVFGVFLAKVTVIIFIQLKDTNPTSFLLSCFELQLRLHWSSQLIHSEHKFMPHSFLPSLCCTFSSHHDPIFTSSHLGKP